uniref:FHA domain-containing protein n=1 Tax=Globisporangium ultimum (strain ATCC 200006 / CBS 805.95 / DAOM BR144) TaxID=431595 RepID=K3WJW3_GLOUD
MPVLTPSRAAFLSSGTADFHPPEWACAPLEKNEHARLEAYRDSRHCATYMISTKKVNVFGRDQENCDHVLGNPSVSRKHAAVIHDEKGGIYIVDLMSRHGTYVGKKKIPPHDPYLLHEGDVVKFGQSIRMYILKGASAEGESAARKKSWGRVKLRPPKVSISGVLPKLPSRPRISALITKLVNDVCYGTMTDEKMDAFVTAVMELSNDEKKEVADFLVEKIQARYEFYAAHVHRNAFVATMTLLKQNLCVEEFDTNLATITHLSQQRYDSIYRADARKILQLMAAVRLDPDNIQFEDSDLEISGDDSLNTCPPTSSNKVTRERVLSDEGKKLFLSGHRQLDRSDSFDHSSESGVSPSRRSTAGGMNSRYGSEYDDEGSESQSNGYVPPSVDWQNNRAASSYPGNMRYMQSNSSISDGASTRDGNEAPSGFSFMAKPTNGAPEKDEVVKGSAFGFISSNDGDDDASSRTSMTDRPSGHSATSFDFLNKGTSQSSSPPLPSVLPEDFLDENPSLDQNEFTDLWESTNESEEWSSELIGSFNPSALQVHLESSRVKYLSSGKVGGQQQWLFFAEQKSNGTIFLVEIMVMPGQSDMTVTLKWIVNDLLYDNGHLLIMDILKYKIYQFFAQNQVVMNETQETTPSYNAQQQNYQNSQQQRNGAGNGKAYAEEEGDDDQMSARDYLNPNPVVEAAKFEQLWASSPEIATLSCSVKDIPEKEDVVELFGNNCMMCLASGSVNQLFKFYFFAEMTELQCVFSVELVMDMGNGSIVGTIKRFSLQSRSEEDEEQIDSSFVTFFEEVLEEL